MKQPSSDNHMQFLSTKRGKNKSNWIEIPFISLPKGEGAIRGIDERFSVNAVNGTLSFSKPLPFSLARGASPSLRISYNSGAGNGVFGLGWNLVRSSRKGKTDKCSPQYDDEADSNTFLFSDAEDLVPEFKKDVNGSFITLPDSTYIINERTSADGLFNIRNSKPRIEGLFARIENTTPDEIENFSETHARSKVTANDLLRTGVACIVFVWSSPMPGNDHAPWKYMDLMNSKKPHMLIAYKTNIAKEVSLKYSPSIKLFLVDRAKGAPWIIRLHFPVHCIKKVAESPVEAQNWLYTPIPYTDLISATTKVAYYSNYSLFIEETEDALGNKSKVENPDETEPGFHFRTLSPDWIKDISGNYSGTISDELGLIIMAASKFFRSMVLVAALFLVLELTSQIATDQWKINTLILLFSFREYVVQRQKCLQKTYQSIVTLMYFGQENTAE